MCLVWPNWVPFFFKIWWTQFRMDYFARSLHWTVAHILWCGFHLKYTIFCIILSLLWQKEICAHWSVERKTAISQFCFKIITIHFLLFLVLHLTSRKDLTVAQLVHISLEIAIAFFLPEAFLVHRSQGAKTKANASLIFVCVRVCVCS